MSDPKALIYSAHDTEYCRACVEELHKHLDAPMLDPDGDLTEQLRDVEVVFDIGGLASRQIIDAARSVKLWQVIGTGLDQFDVNYAAGKGIQLANTPGFASAFGLSECAMMFISDVDTTVL